MGNAASNSANRLSTPAPKHSTALRAKKKSLELPDLASLALNTQSPVRTSAQPIPIPSSRPQNHQMPNVSLQQPSTHIPIQHQRTAHSRPSKTTPKNNPHHHHHHNPLKSSFSQRGRSRNPSRSPVRDRGRDKSPVFVSEVVHSTIPIALPKAEEELAMNTGPAKRKYSASDDPKPVSVKITWSGGGKSVILTRAGDDNWKGRHPMEQEYAHRPLLSARIAHSPLDHPDRGLGSPTSPSSPAHTTSNSSSTTNGGSQTTSPPPSTTTAH